MTHKSRRIALIISGAALLIACGILLILGFCTNTFADLLQVRGNSSANLDGKGIAAESEGWIYTVDGQKEYQGLYRVRAEGGKSEKLFDGNCTGINVSGGWVYFLFHEKITDSDLYKMKTGGGQAIQMKRDVSKALVLGNWIYYQSTDGIHKMRTSGKRDTLIAGPSYALLDVQGRWIYCAFYDNQSVSVCKMRTDGSDIQMVIRGVNQPMVDGDLIYFFTDSKEYTTVERVNLKGEDRKLLCSVGCSRIFIDGERVYLNTREGIYSVQHDGSGMAKVCTDHFSYMNSAGGWLIYDNDIYSGIPSPEFTLYKMRPDGSQESELWGDTPDVEDFEDGLITQPASAGNSNNGGLVTRQGGYVFFVLDHKICRMLESTGEVTVLSYESGTTLYAVGNELYYQTDLFIRNLNRTSIDNFRAATVTTDETRWLTITGDQMYYCNWGKDGYLYANDLSGTDRKWICEDAKVWYLNVLDNQLYYCLNTENDTPGSIVRINVDGNGRVVLYEGHCSNLIVDKEWIYVCNEEEDGAVYKIATDGSQYTGLGISASTLNLSGDWLYYVDRATQKVCRIKTTGTQKSELTTAGVGKILIVGDWIYCYSPDESTLVRISLDGKINQPIRIPIQGTTSSKESDGGQP